MKKFSNSVLGLIAETRKIAEKLDTDFIGLKHFLLAYNKFADSEIAEFNVSISEKKELIRDIKGLNVTGIKSNDFPLTKEFEFVLYSSRFQKWITGDKRIEPKHLYLSIYLIDHKNKLIYLDILERNGNKVNGFKKFMINIQFNPILRFFGIARLSRKIT